MATSLVAAKGSCPNVLLRLPSLRVLQSLLLRSNEHQKALGPSRSLGTTCSAKRWHNESPPGALTELYVYRPESETVWPDLTLGVFSSVDPRFCMPGGLGPAESALEAKKEVANSQAEQNQNRSPDQFDVLTQLTRREHQAQTLHTANDYIQHTSQAEQYVCTGVLNDMPEMEVMRRLRCELHEAPSLLKREVAPMFPNVDVKNGNLSVITLAQKTVNDMTGWSEDVENERESLAEHFVSAAKEICARIKNEGYWADFIDPSSGTPYFGSHTNTTMFETDEKYRLLGFRIEDLGCCKVISHREFGRHVFVGTIFTDVHSGTGIVQDLFGDMKAFLSEGNEMKHLGSSAVDQVSGDTFLA